MRKSLVPSWLRLAGALSASLAFLPAGRGAETSTMRTNVYGEPLKLCCKSNRTGFARDGFCHVSTGDAGRHAICAEVTEAFLAFTKARGNDLTQPQPGSDFPGLQAGDRWCLCVARWLEAKEAKVAPRVDLEATDAIALKSVAKEELEAFRIVDPKH